VKELVYTAIACILFAGCARTLGIQRGLEPEQRLVLEVKKGGCALIRTRLCDVAAEPIDYLKWRKLLDQSVFTGGRRVQADARIPKFLFFHLVVSNVGPVPLVIDSVTLHYGTVEKSPISLDEALKRSKSPAYRAFHFKNILTDKRLMGDEYCLKKINYERDVIDYRLGFVNPGDRVIRIAAFEWVPVQYRDLRLAVHISPLGEGDEKKVIDFNFKRFEYRTRGRYYRRPAEKSEEREP
jgi:hypothetical protein